MSVIESWAQAISSEFTVSRIDFAKPCTISGEYSRHRGVRVHVATYPEKSFRLVPPTKQRDAYSQHVTSLVVSIRQPSLVTVTAQPGMTYQWLLLEKLPDTHIHDEPLAVHYDLLRLASEGIPLTEKELAELKTRARGQHRQAIKLLNVATMRSHTDPGAELDRLSRLGGELHDALPGSLKYLAVGTNKKLLALSGARYLLEWRQAYKAAT